MQQAMQIFRWPAEQRNRDFQQHNRDKPLPPLNVPSPHSSRSRRTSRSPKSSSPIHSPIPTISIDDSACSSSSNRAERNSYYMPLANRRSSFHPTSQCSSRTRGLALDFSTPMPVSSRSVKIEVMSFLKQQEREMREEVARVSVEIRDLRRCVRAARRERDIGINLGLGGGRYHGHAAVLGIAESGSGSDADTEEVNVVVIAAD